MHNLSRYGRRSTFYSLYNTFRICICYFIVGRTIYNLSPCKHVINHKFFGLSLINRDAALSASWNHFFIVNFIFWKINTCIFWFIVHKWLPILVLSFTDIDQLCSCWYIFFVINPISYIWDFPTFKIILKPCCCITICIHLKFNVRIKTINKIFSCFRIRIISKIISRFQHSLSHIAISCI